MMNVWILNLLSGRPGPHGNNNNNSRSNNIWVIQGGMGSDGGNEVISDLFAFANKEVQIRHNLWEGFSDS